MEKAHSVISQLFNVDEGETTRQIAQTKKGAFIGISASCFIVMGMDLINGNGMMAVVSCALGIYMMAAAFHVGYVNQ